ncbi:hypothetical protein [Frigoriflavimonas asaccharolytica]|uniref:Uncharacterized protein n=1 Tax=Frigoriflavimonas asaccharolytica TaxID=2735899 RepID=A0A8J8G9P0_9FLAO|nr:hypothetical protein [Frigoriflavimonas asaccharolytica]NRS93215.1 hypothetical protein [Frigoriflavimonas asaccharolytica]
MKFNIKLNSAETLEEIEHYWTNEDYIQLLTLFNFPDAKTIQPENLREMLFMAISDFEPNEAAEIVLTYKLSEDLNEGQISQISNDMLLDKICEEYPEINLHYALFNINQLLFKAYNGTFLNCKATLVNFEIEKPRDFDDEITKEIVLKSFNNGLSDSNIIKRLFTENMSTETRFEQAEDILWELNHKEGNNYTFITSEYWMNKDEIIASEFEGDCLMAKVEEEE